MKNFSHYFFLLLFTSACTASVVPPTPRWALPTVRYLEDTRELRGQLMLLAGDSLPLAQPLRYPGQIAFLGSGMEEVILPGESPAAARYRYQTTLRTDYPTELRFSFPAADSTQTERQVLELRMTAPAIDLLPDTIQQPADLRFALGADSLRSTESLLLFFTNQANGDVRRVRIAGPTTSDRVRVPPNALTQLEPGSYRLYLVKSQRIDTAADGLRTEGIIEYYTREKDFVVE